MKQQSNDELKPILWIYFCISHYLIFLVYLYKKNVLKQGCVILKKINLDNTPIDSVIIM